MGVLRQIVAVSILGAVLIVGLGCTGTDLTDLAKAEDPAPPPAESTAPLTAPLSNGGGLSEIDEFSVLPFFVPTLGDGAQATDCELTDDPYTSCI